MQNGKVQDLKTLDSGFEVKAYSRFRDKNGRILIVVGGEREWDEKRQVSKGWHTITLFNLSTGRKEEPIIYDRFIHYIARGSLTRHLPKINPQPRF